MALRFVMIGDVVGKPGRKVLQQQLPAIRERWEPDLVVVNAENLAGGSGITPDGYNALMKMEIDGITLGDHVYRQKSITQVLEREENIIRPANLPDRAIGARWMALRAAEPGKPPLCVMTVLGRKFMTGPAADDPYATAEIILGEIELEHPEAVVLIEVHAEATSEKVVMGHYLDGRVAAVVGTHTHVPTADAKVLPGGTAYITDLGMTGPYDSVLGRRKDRVAYHMTTGMPTPFDVAKDDPRVCGVAIDIDEAGRATQIERIELHADLDAPPFA